MTWQAVCVSHEQAGSRYGNPMEIQCSAIPFVFQTAPGSLCTEGRVKCTHTHYTRRLLSSGVKPRSWFRANRPCLPVCRAISPTLLHGSALPAGPGLYGGCKLGRHQSSGSEHQGADLHPCISNGCNKYVCITECYRIMFCHILPC